MMEAFGDSVLVSHPDMSRTLASVTDSYYWPTMTADVEAFVHSCRVCAGVKTNTHLRMGVETFSDVPVTSFSHWDMDLISMPMSRGGHDLIATWVDRTSKTIVAPGDSPGLSKSLHLPHRIWHDLPLRRFVGDLVFQNG